MYILRNNDRLGRFIAGRKSAGLSVGFVPTMGALHEGHLSLIRHAAGLSDVVVCSIFVNPTQFNDPADLEKYPRPLARDIDLLYGAGCDVVYLPDVAHVYPPGLDTSLRLNPGLLARVMEGEFRPGHFAGVMQVVNRLLDLVDPDVLVMGQKDAQQVAVIRFMLKKTRRPVRLDVAPTVREADGLAMSSRNVRLTTDNRGQAPAIFRALSQARKDLDQHPVGVVIGHAVDILTSAGLRPEYFRIVDGLTLEDVQDPADHEDILACTAAWAGDVRLIDNLRLKP